MYLAVDVGGTKTLLGVFDDNGVLGQTDEFHTSPDYPTFKRDLAENVAKLSTKGFAGVGVAIPGKLDREHGLGVTFGNLPWQNVPIKADVAEITHSVVELENDGKTAALAEAAQVKDNYKRILSITIGTGMGIALVDNGVNDLSVDDLGGHTFMLEEDGRQTTWDALASGHAIKAHFGKKAAELTDPADWQLVAKNIALGLSQLITKYHPEAVIIGGGVGEHLTKYKEQLINQLQRLAPYGAKLPAILQATHAEQAVIYGCYQLIRHATTH